MNQLQECINSGQVSAAQVVAHAEAGELVQRRNPRAFIDMNGGFQSHREGLDKDAHDAWMKTNTWSLSRDDFIRLSYFHGDLLNGSDGLGPRNGSDDRSGDVVYQNENGSCLTRAMVSYWFKDSNSFMHGYKVAAKSLTAAPEAEREKVNVLREALEAYANVYNWEVDSSDIRRVWLEPDSSTPTAYNGFEAARSILTATREPQA
jgi:hypothetical protein